MIKWDYDLKQQELSHINCFVFVRWICPTNGTIRITRMINQFWDGGESSAKMKDCGSQSILIIRNGDELETIDIIRYPKYGGYLIAGEWDSEGFMDRGCQPAAAAGTFHWDFQQPEQMDAEASSKPH